MLLMNKIVRLFLLFFIVGFFSPCFSSESDFEFNNQKTGEYIDVKYYPPKKYKLRKTSRIIPRVEQKSSLNVGKNSLNKNKSEFKSRKQTELNRLKKEYRILQYN